MAEERLDILLALKMKLEGAESAFGNIAALKDKLVGLALASAPAAWIRENGELASQLKAVAGQTGLTTDALQTLKYNLAEDAVQVETLTQSIINLRKSMQEAKADPGSAIAEQFRTLRLDAAGLQALKPEQQLEVIGQRLNTAVDRNAAFNAALDILGAKAAPKVLESLKRLATEGLPAWEEKSKALRLTEEQLETLDRAGNHLQRIWDLTKVLGAKVQLRLFDTGKEFLNPATWFLTPGEQLKFNARIQDIKDSQISPSIREAGLKQQQDDAARAAEVRAAEQQQIEQQMSAAALNEQLGGLDAQSRKLDQRISAFQQKGLAAGMAAASKALQEQNGKMEEQAQRYRELADPMESYQRQIREVQALVERGRMGIFGGLTEAEGQAAIERLTAEMNQELPNAIDKSNNALRGFGETLNTIDNNPFLTDAEKHQQRVDVLRQENNAIAEQIKLLQKFAAEHPGVDPAAVRGQIRGLGDRATANNRTIGEFDPNSAGFGANFRRDIVQLQSGLKAPAENIARTLSGTIGGAFTSIRQNISGLIMQTESWQDVLGNVRMMIVGSLVEGIVDMFTTWIEQRALAAIASMGWSAKEGAADATAKAPGALMTSISSFGMAAAIGVAALVAAMAAFGGFSSGGFTGEVDRDAVAGVVHGGEWVAPAWMVDDPNAGRVIAGLEGVRTGGPGALGNAQFAAASSFSGNSITATTVEAARSSGAATAATGPNAGGDHRPRRDVLLVTSDRRAARNALQDPQYRNELRTFMHREYGLG